MRNFQALVFFVQTIIYLFLYNLSYCTFKEVVPQNKFVYIKYKTLLPLNFSSIIFPRVAISNCSSEWDSICSTISRNTVSLLQLYVLMLFFGSPLPVRKFELHSIWYTASPARKSFSKVRRPLTSMAHSSSFLS